MDYQDYYQTLGVARTASQAEIKKAFRRLAREHHPDTKPGDAAAERRFKQINEANAVLSDPEKRKKYDLLGANWEQVQPGRGTGRGQRRQPVRRLRRGAASRATSATSSARRPATPAASPTSSGCSSPKASRRPSRPAPAGAAGRPAARRSRRSSARWASTARRSGAGRHRRQSAGRTARAARPPTAEAVAEITLEEAYHGTTRRVEIDGKRLEVTIPRGADNGTRIKLTGQGPGGGDLVVVVKVRPHPVFTRRGADLERELPITLEEALLGAEVPVTTLKGKVLLRIPAGTQNGRIFRLKGQGMPVLRKDDVGDLLVKVRVVLPADLTPEAREAAEAVPRPRRPARPALTRDDQRRPGVPR